MKNVTFIAFVALAIFLFGSQSTVLSQEHIAVGGNISQNFTIGTSATAAMPTNWKVDKNTTVRLVGTYSAAVSATELRAGDNMSTSAGNGIYNYAAGDPTTATDRAVGGISSSSSSKSVNVYLWLDNNGSSTINDFTISYNVEKYRMGTNTAGFSIQMYYSTNGTTWTSAGTDFLTSFAGADASNAGFTPAPGATVSVTSKTLSQALSAGSSLYLAWNYSVTSGTTTSNAQALGIDDVVIVANGSAGSPTLSVTPSTLTGFTYAEGSGPSASQSFAITGSNLTPASGNLTVTGTTNFEVSDNASTGFGATASIPYTGGALTSVNAYVRLKAGLTAGSFGPENVTVSGGGATSQNVACSGSVTSTSPLITVGTITAFPSTPINSISAEKTYTVSGVNLTSDISIVPPAGFEISTATGFNFVATNPILLTPTGGTVASTAIYVRFAPTLVQSYSGNITHNSTGATEKLVAVSGTGTSTSTLPFSEEFSYTSGQLLTANGWTAHSGAGTNPITVQDPTINYTGYLSSGIGNQISMTNTGEDCNRGYASQTSGNVYVSFLVNVTASNTTGDYFFHLSKLSGALTGTDYFAKVFIKKDPSSTNFAFGLSKAASTTTNYTAFSYALNTTYLVVIKHTFNPALTNDDLEYLYINPTLNAVEPTPVLTTIDAATDPTALGGMALRQGTASNAATLLLDGIRVGNNWSDIVGTAVVPSIIVNSTMTGFGVQQINTPSAEKSYTVSASNMTGAYLIITPPVGFQITTTSGSNYVSNPNTIALAASGGSVPTTTIFVRFLPTATQAYTDSIVHVTASATTVKLAVSGTGIDITPEPSNHVTGFAAGTATNTTIPLTWTDATGTTLPANYLIKGSSVSYAAIVDPVDGTPEANGTLVQNVAYGAQNYTFTGLTHSTPYYFKIYPYTNSGSYIDYKTSATVPQATATTTTPPALVLYEDFNYTAGGNIGGDLNTSGTTNNNWTTHSNTQYRTDSIMAGSLTYSGLATSSGNKVSIPGNNSTANRDVNRALTTSETVMYFSALLNVVDNTQLATSFSDNSYFLHFANTSGASAATYYGRVHIKSVSSGTKYRLGIQNTTSGTPTQTEFAQDLDFGTTYLVVVKYDFNGASNDIATLWVNPSSLGGSEPGGSVSNNSATATTATNFAAICIRNASATPKAQIDEIRVGSTWASVTPAGAPATTTLNLKAFVEGLYNEGLGSLNQAMNSDGENSWPLFTSPAYADTVTIALAEDVAPNYAFTNFFHGVGLNTDGTTSVEVPTSVTGNYYVVLRHRNSVESWSASSVTFPSGTPITLDWTVDSTSVYGNNEKSGKVSTPGGGAPYVIYSGEVCQTDGSTPPDGYIDGGDVGNIFNLAQIYDFGYKPEDLTGDGFIDGFDVAIVFNNAQIYAGKITPSGF